MDGIDAALVQLQGGGTQTSVQLQAFLCHPYEGELHRRLTYLTAGNKATALDWARLDHNLAQAFAQAALAVIDSAGLKPAEIDFIASHGQTLAHHATGIADWDPLATTWQAGNANVIAALTGIPVLADFRSADVALGGTGAPLVPYVDWLLRRSPLEDRIILNIGGIANLTWLPAGGALQETRAWDTGPGNMIIDGFAQALLQQPRDDHGAVAAEGSADAAWIAAIIQQDWFVAKPPKAAGREQFGDDFLREMLLAAKQRKLPVADQMASAVELTVQSVAQSIGWLPAQDKPRVVYVTGGGLHNHALMQRLGATLDCQVAGIDALGVRVDAKEAVDFAVLGNEALLGHAANLPQVTGAMRACVLGSLALSGFQPDSHVGSQQDGA